MAMLSRGGDLESEPGGLSREGPTNCHGQAIRAKWDVSSQALRARGRPPTAPLSFELLSWGISAAPCRLENTGLSHRQL